MSSFKTKNKVKKKEDLNTRVTLDALHNDKIKEFNQKNSNVKKMDMELILLKKKMKQFESKKMSELSQEEIESKFELRDNIENLTDKINLIKTKKEDIDYFLDTGNLLFQYYTLTNDIAQGNVKKNTFKKNINLNSGKSVMEYFKSTVETSSDSSEDDLEGKEILKPKPKNKVFHSRANIYDQYMSKTDNNFVLKNEESNVDVCRECGVEKTLYISDGKLICNLCGEETTILVDSDKPSYKDPPREVSYFAYKRINHFNEWLAQFQAKESTDIPQDVYDNIIIELKKERIINMSELTPQKLREILKKLKKNKYYEHIPHIINKLNGIPPPVMTRETEEELRRMFKEIQLPFHKYCPANRKNFLSYSYVLHKFVQLLELDEFLPCFMLLKSREKLHQQDQIWKQICEHLKWQYIPSI
jgi:predicted amidophosphoribosyltransferase